MSSARVVRAKTGRCHRRRMCDVDDAMRYPASETAEKHTRALQAAARLFRERGFDGASISEIMAATGLTHGSFYNHFDSKEELLAEAFEHASQEALAVVESLEKSREGRQSMYRDYLSAAHRDRSGEGCIMAALATNFQTQPKARSVVTRHIQRLITKFGDHFPWPRRRNARQEAIRALASMVGGVILARAVDEPELSDEILREVLAGLSERV